MKGTSKKTYANVSRRRFLQNAAAVAVAAPSIIPASALGADGTTAPSNRIVIGGIGVGSMGSGDLNEFLGQRDTQVVAVCDVDTGHRNNAKKSVDDRYGNKDCTAYLDFRELIDRGDLDVVFTALPDHWHALPAIMAARAGIDIHGQKPLARSIVEGRAICDAVKRYGRVWQTGSQQRSDGNFRRACELVRNGRIGKVTHIEVGLPTGGATGVAPVMDPPPNLDWDFWLGPSPWKPYTKFSGNAPHWDWRWIMDYSGGQLTDWAGHHIDIAQWGMGYERTGPVEIEGKGVYPDDGAYDAPRAYKFICKYATGVEMGVSNSYTQGAKWIGENGDWIFVSRSAFTASRPEILREEIGPEEIQFFKSPGHKRNFLDCVKSRQETIAPAEIGLRSISVALLGEIAMLTGRKIRWNPDTETIQNDPGASALLGRAYREPWSLPTA